MLNCTIKPHVFITLVMLSFTVGMHSLQAKDNELLIMKSSLKNLEVKILLV